MVNCFVQIGIHKFGPSLALSETLHFPLRSMHCFQEKTQGCHFTKVNNIVEEYPCIYGYKR